MRRSHTDMKIPWSALSFLVLIFTFSVVVKICEAQDYEGDETENATPPPAQENCNGIFLTYNFESKEKEYPHVKNASAQAWSFKSTLNILNAGTYEVKAWKAYIGFQHNELIVSADGAAILDGDGLPFKTGKNGTHIAGYPQTDLKTAIETAGELAQISAKVDFVGTVFGGKASSTPMPKTIKIANEGYKCPAPKATKTYMYVCCARDPKYKQKTLKTKFFPRQFGDLSFTYDVLQVFEGNYLAQVTIDNNHPLGRLTHWNLTWEWMRNEFIYSMRGAYPYKKDPSECLYGPAGAYYKDFDFTPVLNCQKKPVISDLPPTLVNDEKLGKLPFCCRNGSIMPKLMNETQARSIFQMTVYKLPPDMNRTALNPPQNWKIVGNVNPQYKCGPPIRVDPTEFPDPAGIDTTTSAVASWQITCNITKPKPKQAKCCVSFSAYYAESVVPCNTCACGCEEPGMDTRHCDANAKPLLLPPEALLVPFANRTEKAKAWAHMKKMPLPAKKWPCPDNCGVSINWHLDSDYKTGWTARMTLFNWDDYPFEDWFTAVQLNKAYSGYENVYSFNGTKLISSLPQLKNTIFMQGLPGLNYLVGIANGTKPGEPMVPGKQQSIISFLKKHTPHIQVSQGDGFPSKVIFNGEECALPTRLPERKKDGNWGARNGLGFVPAALIALLTFAFMSFQY